MPKSKKSPKPTKRTQLALILPLLARGEKYAGVLLDDKGKPSAHLVLLAGDAEPATWKDAQAWAKKQGGDLPTRQEQALLFANLKKEFQSTWYWSGEQYAGGAGYAWGQYFDDGGQYDDDKGNELRARAVRRVTI